MPTLAALAYAASSSHPHTRMPPLLISTSPRLPRLADGARADPIAARAHSRALQAEGRSGGRGGARRGERGELARVALRELTPRQDELHASVARMAEERRAALGGADGDGGARLDEARERLASAAEALKLATSERDEKRQQERALQSAIEELRSQAANERQRHTDEAKSLDRLLSRKTMLLQKQEEFTACIRKLGHLPKDAFDAHPGLSSKQLLAEIEACHKELSKLGHVNKKALDQFQAFSDERDRLLDKQRDVDKGRTAITELIEHLDRKKDEAIERTFKSVSHEFTEVFNELVPGGSGKLPDDRTRCRPATTCPRAAPRAPRCTSTSASRSRCASPVAAMRRP